MHHAFEVLVLKADLAQQKLGFGLARISLGAELLKLHCGHDLLFRLLVADYRLYLTKTWKPKAAALDGKKIKAKQVCSVHACGKIPLPEDKEYQHE